MFDSRVGSWVGEPVRWMAWIGLVNLLLVATLSACDEGSTPPAKVLPTNTSAPSATQKPGPAATQAPTTAATSTPRLGFGPGTYQVNIDIQPGVYAGKVGTDVLDSCYWERLSGASGELSDLIANSNAVGQFYVEVLSTDKYFKVACDITPLAAWPGPAEPLSKIEPGTYMVGRDIAPGTYRGEAGTGVLDSCYWERLSGVSGEFSNLVANDSANGPYFVSIEDSDFALSTACALELEAPASTATEKPEPTSTPGSTAKPTPDPSPTSAARAAPTPEPTATPAPTATPIPMPTSGFGPGTYQVNSDIQPGIYVGKVGTEVLDSCYWERLSGVSGELSDLIANDNAIGQFYIEVLSTDKYFKVACDITPLSAWPEPAVPLSKIEPGTYLVGRDIAPGTYRGEAGTGVLDSCYWERLSGVSGEFSDLVANDNAIGPYFVSVEDSDFALSTACALELVTQ